MLQGLDDHQLIFKDCIIENQVFKTFLSFKITDYDLMKGRQSYDTVTSIFSCFFNKISLELYPSCDNKPSLINTLLMYVALIPFLCKQFQELLITNQSLKQNPTLVQHCHTYLSFLKSILLSFMVSFQSLSLHHPNISTLISTTVNLVMPTFFPANKPTSH